MKHFLIFFALLLTSISAFADVPTTDFGVLFNRLPGQPLARKYQLGNKLREMHNTAICEYDFATSGGAVSTINLVSPDLTTPCQLPSKAVLRNGMIDIITAFTSSGSATVAISSGKSAADIMAAQTYTNFAVGSYQVTPTFTNAATWFKITAANTIVSGNATNASQVTLTIGTAALTAGRLRVFIDYVLSR